MTEQRSPVDEALDLFVFGPLGLALTAREQFPRLAAKGRQQVTNQLSLARMVGQFAVSQGRQEANKLLKQATETLVALGVIPRGDEPSGQAEPRSESPPERQLSVDNGRVDDERGPGPLSSAGLAIPGYDSLSASQVVPRLAGLAEDELEAVRFYESATRGRRTILSKIAQLQSQQP